MNDSFRKLAIAAIAISANLTAGLGNSSRAPAAEDLDSVLADSKNEFCSSNTSPPPCASLRGGNMIQKNQCPAAYNLPAAYVLANDSCSRWMRDFFFDASYTYWYIEEEGLEIGISGLINSEGTLDFTLPVVTLCQPFRYQSGFKVGAGWRHDDWMVSGEYTWVRQTLSQSVVAPTANPAADGKGVWSVSPWFQASSESGQALSGTSASSKWGFAMDLADLSFSRPFYQGRSLIVTPFGGLRGAWIRQKMKVGLDESPLNYPGFTIPAQPIYSHTRSQSWAVGPRFGSGAQVLFCRGFRVQGDLAASVLFTQYPKLSHNESAVVAGSLDIVEKYNCSKYSTLRTALETGLGFAWGGYFCCDRYHVDISAQYDFKIFWDQNMMRFFLSEMLSSIPVNYDLHLHGVTATARFDF